MKPNIKRYSLLGLVLVTASAITAAVLPKDDYRVQNGRAVASTDPNTQTCITEAQQSQRNCFNTESAGTGAASATTDGAIGDSGTASPNQNTSLNDAS